jgi:hypothetical protein
VKIVINFKITVRTFENMQEDHEEKVGLVNSDLAGPTQVENIDLLAPGQLTPVPADEPYAAWDAEPEPTGLKD